MTTAHASPVQWTRPVLLLVAIEPELRHVARALGVRAHDGFARGRLGERDAVVHAVGMGGGAARAVAEEEPRAAVSCGYCGALDERLRPGDLVLATAVRDEGTSRIEAPRVALAAARRALAGMRVLEGEMLCTTVVAATPDEKRALGAQGCVALDMETYPLARAAQQAGIPWLAVRAVVDPLDGHLPPFAREPHKDYVGPALLHALSHPAGALEIARLAAHARKAGHSLEEAVHRLGSVFAAEAVP